MVFKDSENAPRDLQQIRSKRYHDKKQSNLGSSNVPDQVWEALAMVNKHEFVAEVVYTRGNNMPPSIICYSQMQMEDMKLHCENDPDSILGIDRTFNLGPTYVTNFVYKNKKVVKKSSRDHPIFVGPVFFHWDASYYTYHSFLSHVKARLDADVKYIDIRIGSDDEGGDRYMVKETTNYPNCFKNSTLLLIYGAQKTPEEKDKLYKKVLAHKTLTDKMIFSSNGKLVIPNVKRLARKPGQRHRPKSAAARTMPRFAK
ncbi:Hypothetical predicted protein [Mytilus galloprovincialis]|uniref:Uncharacterized protein n=1 Tax=Mytilus galloprovincialis TaxID=29158 RepID=A0A8B6CI80_MYTGA|nr:Hypothetical predicted protein [Mytilus galloprovincialis]